MALSWAAALAVYLAWPHPAPLGLTILIASGFRCWWPTHLVALGVRVAIALRQLDQHAADAHPEQVTSSRRVFVRNVLVVSGAALSAVLLERWFFGPERALAQDTPRGGGPQAIPAGNAAATIGPVTVECQCDKCDGGHTVPLDGVTVGRVNTPNKLSATIPG